jgi:hypothetical protein
LLLLLGVLVIFFDTLLAGGLSNSLSILLLLESDRN